MTNATDRFQLPFILPGQAGKETTHNEALAGVDSLLFPAVETVGDDAPPATPVAGHAWIVGSAPSGAWAGHPGAVATWTSGGWRFVAGRAGLRAWVISTQLPAEHDGTGWTVGAVRANEVRVNGLAVVGAQQPAIAAPTGGSTVDTQARAALAAMLTALRSHGLIAS